jgi:Uma2 family endonuclease
MSGVPKKKLTAAEYLAIEEKAEFKSEFFDGVMYPVYPVDELTGMAGASVEHNRIKENLVVELGGAFRRGPCETFSSDQRVQLTPTGMYAYPDIVVVCGPPEFAAHARTTITNPQVVIEVLSPSTESYDRGLKFAQYRRQPTIREVVFVWQDTVRIERYVRQPSGDWLLTEFDDPAGTFALATVPAAVPLADVYRRVEPPPQSA